MAYYNSRHIMEPLGSFKFPNKGIIVKTFYFRVSFIPPYNKIMPTIKLSSPVSMVDTDQAGFQVSGWKSLMERQSRVFV